MVGVHLQSIDQHTLRSLAKQCVTNLVSVDVIDELEAIKINEHDIARCLWEILNDFIKDGSVR